MRAALYFDMDEDRPDFMFCVKGKDWALVSWDMANELRKWLKYGHKFETADEAIEAARELLFDTMEYYGVSLDDIP